jgi:formate dehydrogenase alpha subunit
VEAVTITLDGVEVSGYSGMTVLELARESGVDIPTLCHDRYLAPTGACRLCIVEEESSGALLASCVAPIRAGMVINTRSPRVIERRRLLVQLMLASHPDSCLVCDKGNQCQLRKLGAEMGIGLVELQRIPRLAAIEEVNPFIERDLSRCILCAKCIRADQELVVEGAIDYIGRGFTTKPATLNNMPLEQSECTFCGSCVAICPTGALMEKTRSYHGTANRTVDTVCPFCGCGCTLHLEVKDNRIVRARPGESPVNHGTLCVRGSYGYDFVHSPERLVSPLIKTDGEFKEATWEEAISRVAAEFKRLKQGHGADSLAVLGSSKCTNEENYLLQRLARVTLGTNNIDNGSRLYSAASRAGLGQSIGFPGTTNSLEELEKSEVIMVIGADPPVSAPAVGYAIKRAARYKGAKLIVVDVRPTGLAPFAHIWLKPRVGTDVALLNGMARVIIEEKLFDQEFVARKTDNFDGLSQSLKPYTLEQVEKITGIPGVDVERAARTLAQAEWASIVYGNGITQHVNGVDSVMALANLAMLTGNIEGRGGGIFALQRDNNAQGACDMGSLPDFLPGYHSIDDGPARSDFEGRWGSRLPGNNGLSALEMMEQAQKGRLKGMLIVGENPASSFPQPSRIRKALDSLEFLAVADLFLTETAKLADVVLPSASFAEKEGTFTNFEGRTQPVRKAIEPVGGSLPDWKITLRLAREMGPPMPYSSLQDVINEIEELVPFYQHFTAADLEKEDVDWAGLEGESVRTSRLYKGPFPSGFGRLSPAQYTPPARPAGNGYPLTLLSGSVLPHFGSGTRSLKAPRLKQFSPEPWLEIGRNDAKRLGFGDGDQVRVASPAGELTTTVRVTDSLPSGLLFLPIPFPESPAGELFDIKLDPRSKAPSLKSCMVRLERTTS